MHLAPAAVAMLVGSALLHAGCLDDSEVLVPVEEWRASLREAEDPFLLDVRTPEEHAERRIEGAVLIPHEDVRDRADELPADKDETIWAYCRTDRRSQMAAATLADMGHTDVRVLEGGINAWADAGHPVATPEGESFASFHHAPHNGPPAPPTW